MSPAIASTSIGIELRDMRIIIHMKVFLSLSLELTFRLLHATGLTINDCDNDI